MKKLAAHPYLTALVVLAAALLLSAAVGSVVIPLPALFRLLSLRLSGQTVPPELVPYNTILFSLRLPRTALVALVGAGLAGSGAGYQGLFRNPLADPYLIGVASGAGLGAVAAMSLGWPYTLGGMLVVPLAAFLGAVLTVGTVYRLARVGKTLPVTTMILAGVAVSSFTTALTSYLMLRGSGELRRALVWLLGGATMSGWQPVLAVLPYVTVGLLALAASGHALNVLQFGDEEARQLGLPVERTRRVVIGAASLATAAAISFAGIIGFIGLIVPHLARLVWGSDYRRLVPLSVLLGAGLLLAADVLARVVMAPAELPVGVITALAGAPFFLWVLRRSKGQTAW